MTRRVCTRLVVECPTARRLSLPPPARPRRRHGGCPLAAAWPVAGLLAPFGRGPLVAGLRSALGLLGAVQLVLGLAQVGRGATADHLHPTGQHLWHESAAWNVAVGAGFLFVALRRSPPAGLLPMLSAFVGMLLLLSVNDLATGSVGGERLISHGFLVVGYLITVLLSRPGLRPGGPAPQRQPTPSRWRFGSDEVERPLRVVRPESYPAQAADRYAAPAAHAGRATRTGEADERRVA